MEYRKLTFQFYLLNHRALEDAEFPAEPFIVNAYHSPGILDLRFGIFLPPVYQYGRPKLLNFATMGTTLGHELGHEIEAFMEEVENYDNDTCHIYKERRNVWWSNIPNLKSRKLGRNNSGSIEGRLRPRAEIQEGSEDTKVTIQEGMESESDDTRKDMKDYTDDYTKSTQKHEGDDTIRAR
ncbi:endothelin-converting enzyme 1 [Caerostris extrusa]|uniref:Endothelin-converting enzyme 1 n=1 Tax=Caerostris extrusa TaxID=172846 RepID=A0AAV4RYI5_CAEEX|nr:endothelin-converting enzyme 1 [Caerostris extrusa]